MSSVVDLIAEVLRQRIETLITGFESEAEKAGEDREYELENDLFAQTGGLQVLLDELPDIAAALQESLNLTEERRTNAMSSAGQTTSTVTGITTHHVDIRYDHRFVTPWSPLPSQSGDTDA